MFRRTYALCILFSLCFAAFNLRGEDPSGILTPPAPATPHINGPKIYGARPGRPFLYRIPCTGTRPIRFSAHGLPASLKLDDATGIISGSAPPAPGVYTVSFKAVNARGKNERSFKIVVGDKLGLTPQMGWNDWYTYYKNISDADVRKAADAMVSSGMADYGYQFVSIDDGWARKQTLSDPTIGRPARDADGNILPNGRFPNMKSLTDHLHSLGLKAGIYTSPGPLTCAKFEGSYQHEAQDATQFANWGFDLLKYDMCSYRTLLKTHDVEELQEPYVKMGALVRNLDRDVVFNMCQQGQGDVWKWGRSVGGNSWRTTKDIGIAPITSLPFFYSVGFANSALNDFAGPGGWNDPDYIMIGTVGNARKTSLPAQLTRLTHDEQYSYMSMWALMASPLFFSGDMTKLDAFTLNVLDNSEVIDIDQDSLGQQGKVVRHTPTEFVLARKLDDGSIAIGLFNLAETGEKISVDLQDLNLSGKEMVRDVWRQHNIGWTHQNVAASVPPHGVSLLHLIGRKSATH